jgi:hypothetical protein
VARAVSSAGSGDDHPGASCGFEERLLAGGGEGGVDRAVGAARGEDAEQSDDGGRRAVRQDPHRAGARPQSVGRCPDPAEQLRIGQFLVSVGDGGVLGKGVGRCDESGDDVRHQSRSAFSETAGKTVGTVGPDKSWERNFSDTITQQDMVTKLTLQHI